MYYLLLKESLETLQRKTLQGFDSKNPDYPIMQQVVMLRWILPVW